MAVIIHDISALCMWIFEKYVKSFSTYQRLETDRDWYVPVYG